MRVAITTLGCKSNQYDSSALEEALAEAGCEITGYPGPADAVVINTCTVTGRTDGESRRLARRARRLNPEAVVILTGCYAQVSSEEASRVDGVDYVLGNTEKDRVAEFVLRGRPAGGTETVVGDWREGAPLTLRASSASGRTRANLKIQEGCSRACSYCIIPRARGLERSLALDEVEREVDTLIEAGYKEVVLTGIHLGAWGADLDPARGLEDILTLAEKRLWPVRLRLSSLDPDEVTDGILDLMTSPRVCSHLHVALQSGDDSVIRRMKRDYTGGQFAERVEKAVESVPGIAVGADVIAGFPGEGEAEFESTFGLLSVLPLAYLHVFPYSPRRGTAAATYTDQVHQATVKERCRRLAGLDSEKRRAFSASFVGTEAEVLIESERDGETGLLRGRTSNYIPVLVDDDGGGDELMNTLSEVRLTGLTEKGMTGVVTKEGLINSGKNYPEFP